MNRPLDILKLKETFLQCNICTLAYDEDDHHPRVFNCLHGACFTCVKTLVKNEKLKCHVCRMEYKVPNNDVKKWILKDFTRRDLLNFVQVQEPSAVIVCDSCLIDETKKHAINRCKSCAEFLCKDCSEAHRKVKATREHQLFALEQFKNNFNYKDFWFEGQCPEKEHEQEKLTLYCKNEECQVPLCLRCAFLKHQGHDTENINIVFEDKKQLLEEKLRELGAVTNDRQHHLKKLEFEIRNLNTSVEESQKHMDFSFEQCQAILENRRKEHNVTLIKLKESKYKSINQQQDDIDAILEQTKQSCEFAQQALEYRNPSAFLLIEKTISERLQRLIEIVYDSYPHQTSFVQFDENEMVPNIEEAARNLGRINFTSSFLPDTKVIFPPVVTRNSPDKIQIRMFDHCGNDVTREKVKLTVKISNGTSQPQEIEATPSNTNGDIDGEDDTEQIYEAFHKPTVSGEHEFTVSVFGIEIPEKYYFVVKEDERIDLKEEEIDTTPTHKNTNQNNYLEFLNQKYLQCVLCQETFDEHNHFPRLMKCLHQIGDSCLNAKVIENKNGKLECPVCYESYELDEHLSDKYPRNYTWRQLNDFIFAQEPDKHLEADCCDSKKQISYWCKECASFMCEVCKKAHRQLLSTKWHSLLELKNDLCLEPNGVVDFRHMTTCTERDHQNERLPIFCCDCKKALCILCVITHNSNNELGYECHKLNIKIVYEEKTNETTRNISALYNRLEEVNGIIRNVKDEDEAVDRAADRAKADINSEFKILERMLNERKQHLLSAVEIEREEKKALLKEQLEDLEFHKRIILDNLDTSELALKFKDAPAYLMMHDVINERLEELALTPKDTRPHTSAQIKFAMSKPDTDCKQYFPHIGFIDSNNAYLPASVIKFPDAVFENTEVSVTVNLYDSNGENAKGITNGIRLKVAFPDNRTEIVKAQTNSNIIRYTWKPKTTGNHHLCVYLQDGCEQSKNVTCIVQKMKSSESPKTNEKGSSPTPIQMHTNDNHEGDKIRDTGKNLGSTEKNVTVQSKDKQEKQTTLDMDKNIESQTKEQNKHNQAPVNNTTPSSDKNKQPSAETKPPAENTIPLQEKAKLTPSQNTKPTPENTKQPSENTKPSQEKAKPSPEKAKPPPSENSKPPPENTELLPKNTKPSQKQAKPPPSENTKPPQENTKPPPSENIKPPQEITKPPPSENTIQTQEKAKPQPSENTIQTQEKAKPQPSENTKPLPENTKPPPSENTKQSQEKAKLQPSENTKPPPENTKPPPSVNTKQSQEKAKPQPFENTKPPPENTQPPPSENIKPPPKNTKHSPSENTKPAPAENTKRPSENTKSSQEKAKPPPSETSKPPPENTKSLPENKNLSQEQARPPPSENTKPPTDNTKPPPSENIKPPPENTKQSLENTKQSQEKAKPPPCESPMQPPENTKPTVRKHQTAARKH